MNLWDQKLDLENVLQKNNIKINIRTKIEKKNNYQEFLFVNIYII